MSIDISNVLKFKKDINEDIDAYLNLVHEGITPGRIRSLLNTITYYNRVKAVNTAQASDDDDDIIEDDDSMDSHLMSDEEEPDYTKVMKNRIWSNNPNRDQLMFSRESILGPMSTYDSGEDDDIYYCAAKQMNINKFSDSSTDPVDYNGYNGYSGYKWPTGLNASIKNSLKNVSPDELLRGLSKLTQLNVTNVINELNSLNEPNEPNESSESDSFDPIVNNTKQSLLPFVADDNIEILTDDIVIDYGEPVC